MGAAKAAAAEAALVEDTHEIDHDILAAEALAELRLLVYIAVVEGEAGQHQQMLVQLPVARQHGDPMAVLDQAGDQPCTQETSAAEYADRKRLHVVSESESAVRQNRAAR